MALFERLPGLLAVAEVDAAGHVVRIAEANAGWRAAFGTDRDGPLALPGGDRLAAVVRDVAAGRVLPDAALAMEVPLRGGLSTARPGTVVLRAEALTGPTNDGADATQVLIRGDAEADGPGRAAQEAEARYRVFLDLSAEGVWRCDVDVPIDTALSPDDQLDAFYVRSYLAECNGAFARMYGFEDPELLLGTRLGDLIPRDDPRNEAYLRAWIASGYRLTGVESHERGRGGTPLVFENSITGQIEHGRLVRAWGTQRDVTARWQADEDRRFLADLDTRLHAASADTSVADLALAPLCAHLGVAGCALVEVDGGAGTLTLIARVADVPARTRAVLPLRTVVSPALHHALSAGQVVAIDDAAAHPFTADRAAALEALSLQAMLIAPVARDGDWVAALLCRETSPRAWRADECDLVAAVAARLWPAVERARANAALRESEDRFRHLADHVPAMIWLADADGACTYLSRGWHVFTGQSEAEALAHGWSDAIHPDDRDAALATFDDAVATQSPCRLTYRLRRHDGTYRWALGEARPRIDDAGTFLGHAGVVVDITEQRALEAALRDLNADLEARVAERTAQLEAANGLLEARNRDLHDFAHVASHDLQEPLRKIRQFADLLVVEEAAAFSAEGQRYIERIQDASQRMNRLISALLAYSRVATRTDPTADVELGAALADVLSDLDLRLHETRGRVEVPVPLPTVVADGTQVRQLLLNLVGNALKFHREGVPPVVRVTSERAGGAVRLVVEDNGIGFDARHAERIFAPFQRLHTRGSYEGSGVGLAIVRRIAERHGWTVRAEGTPGEGSRFTLTIPDPG